MKSLISDNQVCVVCGTIFNLHRHHIYAGSRRKASEKYGCTCYLCGFHHNLSSHGVHADRELDLKLKRKCQERWEEEYGTREDFIRIFGKSYL